VFAWEIGKNQASQRKTGRISMSKQVRVFPAAIGRGLAACVFLLLLIGCRRSAESVNIEIAGRYESYFSSNDYRSRAKIAEDLVKFLESNQSTLVSSCDFDYYLGIACARVAYNRERILDGRDEPSSIELIRTMKERSISSIGQSSQQKVTWEDILTLLNETRTGSETNIQK
jgi:hypothetical protein